jgi:pimeloyl-ACP methyl ester carboxylesterase
MPEISVREVDVAGCAVKLRSVGHGAPLIVLGDVFGPQAWSPALDILARKREVLCPIHPGFGGGRRPEWLDTVSDLAVAYLDLMDRMDLRHVDLMGFGLGGWIAADLAVRNSGRLRSLTLVGAHGLSLRDHPLPDIFLQSEEALMRSWFVDQTLAELTITKEVTAETEDVRLQDQELAARIAWEPRLHDPQVMKWLHRITVPALVVWGEQDAVLPLAYALEWQARLPTARVTVIADCGHAPHFERPELFAGLVDDFLANP